MTYLLLRQKKILRIRLTGKDCGDMMGRGEGGRRLSWEVIHYFLNLNETKVFVKQYYIGLFF